MSNAFNFNFSEVSTAQPLVEPGEYAFVIHEVKTALNKATTGHNMCVTFLACEDLTSVAAAAQGKSGDMKNFKRSKYYPLQKGDVESSFDPLVGIKQLLMAATGFQEKDERWATLDFAPMDKESTDALLVGCNVVLKLGNGKDEPPYGVQTEIKAVKFLSVE